MKRLIFFLGLLISLNVTAQSGEVPIRGDSVVIYKKGGNADLVIKNSTRDTAGIAINVGAGKIAFRTPVRVNDSTIQIGPVVIITGSGTSHGDTIFIAAAVDTFYTTPIGVLSPSIQTLYTVSGPNFSNLRHSNWGAGIFTIPGLAPDSSAFIDVDTAGLRAWLISALTSSAFPGLDDVLSVNQNLLSTHTSDFQTFKWNITGAITGGNSPFEVDNSSTGNAITAQSISGSAFVGSTTAGGKAADLTMTASSTNTALNIVNLYRGTSGTAAAGMGEYINYQLKDASGNIQDAGRLQYEWQDATTGTRTAIFKVRGVTNASLTDWMTADGQGGVNSNGTITGFTSTNAVTAFSGIGSSIGMSMTSITLPGFFNNSTNANTDVKVLELSRQGPSTGAIGLGGYLQYSLKDDAGALFNAGSIHVLVANAAHATPGGKMILKVSQNNIEANVFILNSGGTWNAPQVGTWGNYANNAAAISGGLGTGDFYRNGDVVQIVH